MHCKVTVLCENSVAMPFGGVGEHGFACYIETPRGNYMFDTGQGLGLSGNAQLLHKDLAAVEAVMISHGHYDHTGGLPQVLQQAAGPLPVYGHPEMFVERFWGPERRYIGIPFTRSYLTSLGAEFRLSRDPREVGPGLWLTGEVPRRSSFETGDANMVAVAGDGSEQCPDPILDDLSLVVDSAKGLIVILGCAHAGLINILDHVCEHFADKRIYAVLGGTHLGFADPSQFEATLAAIDDYQIEKLGVSHCTGLVQAARLHARMPERSFFACVGAELEV